VAIFFDQLFYVGVFLFDEPQDAHIILLIQQLMQQAVCIISRRNICCGTLLPSAGDWQPVKTQAASGQNHEHRGDQFHKCSKA